MKHRPDKPLDLGGLAPHATELASALASVATDIALVIDSQGVIQNVATAHTGLSKAASGWVGRHWGDTVSQESRRKVELLLDEAGTAGVSRKREVNLAADTGASIPMAYTAIRLGDGGPLIAVGRDLGAIAAIQQRFVQSQQDMEQTYWKKRQAESRYRLLFQVATDAVLVVDALTLNIVEANEAAARLFHLPATALVGRGADSGIDAGSRPVFHELLVTARTTGQPAEVRARVATSLGLISVAATPFRADTSLLLMVRARAVELPHLAQPAARDLTDFVDRTAEAVVVTDSSGTILMANPAFTRMCERTGETQVKGRRLEEALGSLSSLMPGLLAEVRRRGLAGPLNARVGDGPLPPLEIDIVATLLEEGDQECIGFTLRPREARPLPMQLSVDELAQAFAQLTSLLGSVPLADLMTEATHLAERHLVKSALEHAHGNRAIAAEVLGIGVTDLGLRMRHLDLLPAGSSGGKLPPPLLN
jgi:transcriptional regulator PpsR